MSKAFTKEDDQAEVDIATEEDSGDTGLPAGVKNYITPEGFRRLRDELEHLARDERPKVVEVISWAAGNGDRSENGDYIYGKKRLREIDRRIRFLTRRLEAAEVVDPTRQKHLSKVFFGATVTYATEDDREHQVRLVGIDEADAEHGRISWRSPVAQALMKGEVGDSVTVRTPQGAEFLEIIAITYG